jgi:predicted protein tyrosine phosphatase
MKNILFDCRDNKVRSVTAELGFSDHARVNAIGAGTNSDAETTVTGDLIEWADAILVMEKTHKNKIAKKFRDLLKGKKLAVLDIPDNYDVMDEELVEILKRRVPKYIQI